MSHFARSSDTTLLQYFSLLIVSFSFHLDVKEKTQLRPIIHTPRPHSVTAYIYQDTCIRKHSQAMLPPKHLGPRASRCTTETGRHSAPAPGQSRSYSLFPHSREHEYPAITQGTGIYACFPLKTKQCEPTNSNTEKSHFFPCVQDRRVSTIFFRCLLLAHSSFGFFLTCCCRAAWMGSSVFYCGSFFSCAVDRAFRCFPPLVMAFHLLPYETRRSGSSAGRYLCPRHRYGCLDHSKADDVSLGYSG